MLIKRDVLLIFQFLGLMMSSLVEGSITCTSWGSVNGQTIMKYMLRNKRGQEVDVVSYGATITSVRTPDKSGNVADVVLGFDNIEGYLSSENPYFGATVGRVANRIGKARFILDGVEYNVSKNRGENSLHGGFKGWNSKVWNSWIENERVAMTLLSQDGDEGYPGDVIASATFELTEDGELRITMKAFVTKATPINLTNHSYFNLAGHGTNATEVYAHKIKLNADRWTVTDSQSIPTGELRSFVDGDPMDLRSFKVLGDVINKVPGGGFDYNFCLPGNPTPNEIRCVAEVIHPSSGRSLDVYSNQPGVQFYTSNFLPQPGSKGIVGKQGKKYFRHGAFCLETQNYPDAINHKNFPDSVLRPGYLYNHTVIYKFGVKA